MRRFVLIALIVGAFNALPTADAAMIVGGRPATRPYTFMASLQRTSNGAHRCGASLVRAQWMLTAAHCVEGFNADQLRIMIGSQKLSEPADVIPLADILIHPEYDGGPYDVALLRLETPATQTPTRIAELGEQPLWAPGKISTAIGWGSNNYAVGSSPDQLHEVEVPVVSDADCGRSYPTFGFHPSTEVCAGEPTGLKDTCQGDSGGPLMVPDATGSFIVFGTVSWGLGCAFPLFYGVYGEAGGPVLRPWLESKLPPEATLNVGGASGLEGGPGQGNSLTFTVTKSGTTARTVRVSYSTADGSAVAGSDFVTTSGTLTFGPGDTERTITVPLVGDGLAEGNETFSMVLSGAIDAAIGKAGTGVATIQDDD